MQPRYADPTISVCRAIFSAIHPLRVPIQSANRRTGYFRFKEREDELSTLYKRELRVKKARRGLDQKYQHFALKSEEFTSSTGSSCFAGERRAEKRIQLMSNSMKSKHSVILSQLFLLRCSACTWNLPLSLVLFLM
ncbi:uncharacterized protein LOC117171069 [Belonocnema kinseyi]|uniref:uncharacterized protein LOC117171069 n=1 Tax=Belonocnema kinseyi TaxID=2817044 RepID=UPI00143DA727|nr:uncharacterized protein LOC117171069 [Belonocnema kinseyi]